MKLAWVARNWASAFLTVWIVAVMVFLFAPIVTAVVFSFNEGVLGRQTTTITGLTMEWYSRAWSNETIRTALATSLRVAAGTTVVATIVGTTAGFVLARSRRRLMRGTLEGLVYMLLLVPEIVLAFGLLLLFSNTGFGLGTLQLVAAHSAFTTAVVALIVRSRVLTMDPAMEEAAADLGAGRFRRATDIVFPQVAPAVLAGAVLAFVFSFDDVVISNFLATPTVTTLPVYLFGSLRTGLTPGVYAIASSMLGFTLVILAVLALGYRWQQRRVGGSAPLVSVLAGEREG
jgi:ABC-type spermidine/putrescine transport system permease subunit II